MGVTSSIKGKVPLNVRTVLSFSLFFLGSSHSIVTEPLLVLLLLESVTGDKDYTCGREKNTIKQRVLSHWKLETKQGAASLLARIIWTRGHNSRTLMWNN